VSAVACIYPLSQRSAGSENGKLSHLVGSIHVGTCPHQHLHNLEFVAAISDSHVKGRITVLQ